MCWDLSFGFTMFPGFKEYGRGEKKSGVPSPPQAKKNGI